MEETTALDLFELKYLEEIHELFDDLLGLGLYDEYLQLRAENRDLAFSVGNIGELLYLFDTE